MPLSQDLLLALAELLSFEDVACLAMASVSTLRTLEAANRFLSSSAFAGMELFGWRPFEGALFQQLQESVQPQLLVDISWCAHRKSKGSATSPMGIALDTSGRFFVKFWVSAGNAWNGCPSVGVADAAEVRQHPSKLSEEDLSRPSKPSDTLGISCNPYTGKVHASHTSKLPKQVLGDSLVEDISPPRSWSTKVLGWQSGERATLGEQRHAIEAGMIISNGTLQFIRKGPEGWECSGIVWDQLPEKVICCAFLFEFVGQAIVSIEEFHVNELPCCSQLHGNSCGKVSSWKAWPPA